MNIVTFPTRDASPPLEVAFSAWFFCVYTPAPVSMIGYTTYTFRHRGSDFLVRATETSTSRYRITALPYQFFPFYHRKTHLPIAQTASTSADAPVFPEKRKKCIKWQSAGAKIPVWLTLMPRNLICQHTFTPPRLVFWEMRHIFAALIRTSILTYL